MIEARLALARAGFKLDVALELPGQGVSALFGPSGCGKTTLLRALAGLEHAAGRVALGAEVWQDDASARWVPPHQRPLGYVIQEAALFPHLSVLHNLQYGLKRVPVHSRRIALDQVVALLGIGHLLPRRPHTLSGGERQRVAIGRALATSPQLLLMDEPLAALDARRKAELLPYLDRLQAALAIPIVYVSHSIDEVVRLADHLVLMDGGRVLASGALAATLARADLPQWLGEDAGAVLEAVVAERDPTWQLARLELCGTACSVWTRDQGVAHSQRVRLRVLARDVSITREQQIGTSIGNQLRGTVEALLADQHPALVLVRVRLPASEGAPDAAHAAEAEQVGAVVVVAQLTRRSAHLLGLELGMPVWAQVKTVALME